MNGTKPRSIAVHSEMSAETASHGTPIAKTMIEPARNAGSAVCGVRS